MPHRAPLLLGLFLATAVLAQEPAPSGPQPLDIGRIRELHHLSEVLGDDLWPGLDTREIPVAVNLEDRHEILIGHPSPPAEYQPLEGCVYTDLRLTTDGFTLTVPQGRIEGRDGVVNIYPRP